MTPSHPSSGTYFVQDQQNEEEFLRVAEQDRLVTASMGGVLAEQENAGRFLRVLDVACGVGNWAIEAAQTYPDMALVGIDSNPRMIASAREQAEAQHVSERVEFRMMDALQVLDFPDRSFDMVNLRFALGFVRTWEWSRLLSGLSRILRPGGVVRITEEEVIHQSNSPASMQFCTMLECALFRSGHLFTQESNGLTNRLASLLSQQGFQQVQTRSYALHYQAGTPEGQTYVQDGIRVLRTLRPFVQKWGCLGEDYETIQQQAIEEMTQSAFSATWHLLTVWGSKPR